MEAYSNGFNLDSTSEGAARLREAVKDKLPHFMGYTDENLAEYVVVLVCNNKPKEQTIKDLHAFLGEHSNDFVSWLWDHVASNIDFYIPSSQQSLPAKVSDQIDAGDRGKEGSETQAMKNDVRDSMLKTSNGDTSHLEPVEKPKKSNEVRRRRDWNFTDHSSARENETPRHDGGNLKLDEPKLQQGSEIKSKPSSKRNRSPEPWSRRDRLRSDDDHKSQRKSSVGIVRAPCRLLQSAVREAVGPAAPSLSKRPESSTKRLRSVVATTHDALDAPEDSPEGYKKLRSVVKQTPAMAVAIKAAAEAAEDVSKGKLTVSVFDRLGKRAVNASSVENGTLDGHSPKEDADNLGSTTREAENQESDHMETNVSSRITHRQRSSVVSMENKGVENFNLQTFRGGRDNLQESKNSRPNSRPLMLNKELQKVDEEPTSIQHHLSKESRMQKSFLSPNTGDVRYTSSMSVKSSTLKAPQLHSASTTPDPDTGIPRQDAKLSDQLGLKAGNSLVGSPTVHSQATSNANLVGGSQKDNTISSGVNITAQLTEDSDSRTVYVSNVHFAASKEALSKHFSRCGEIVNVILLTDATTGQSKGSAYVECASKEIAESALTLNETSFMSRMLKVVRKGAANIDASAVTRPPLRRPLSINAWRPTRAIPRGFPGTYRRVGYGGRPFGGRSLQWKRDTSGATTESSPTTDNTTPTGNPSVANAMQLTRSLTYVRNPTSQPIESIVKPS